MIGVLLSDDLIFSSRVTATARAIGATVHTVKSVERLLPQTQQTPPTCIILDLHVTGAEIQSLITELKNQSVNMPYLVAYGSHVNQELLKAGREAGCNLVLPRSRFVSLLEGSLKDWLSQKLNDQKVETA